jgi:hypothetical protein
MIIESIKEGFRITHKNWQVVLLKLVAGVINLFGLFVLVGLPTIIGILSLGIDIANARDILPAILEDPGEVFSRYLGIAILIIIAILSYFFFASILILYVLSGTLGVLRNAAIDKNYRFSLSSFFSEAKRIFFPLLWLFSIAILGVTGILVTFGIIGTIIFSFVSTYSGEKTTMMVFTTYFLTLFGIVVVMAGIIFTAYAAVSLVVEKTKVIDSFKKTWRFIQIRPTAFVFYLILFTGIILIDFIFIALGAPLNMSSVTGFLFVIPHRLISYIVQSYLGVVMWGSLTAYYIKTVNYPVSTVTPPLSTQIPFIC